MLFRWSSSGTEVSHCPRNDALRKFKVQSRRITLTRTGKMELNHDWCLILLIKLNLGQLILKILLCIPWSQLSCDLSVYLYFKLHATSLLLYIFTEDIQSLYALYNEEKEITCLFGFFLPFILLLLDSLMPTHYICQRVSKTNSKQLKIW